MRVTRRGRVTIPKPLRDKYGWMSGTELEFARRGKTIFIRKVGSNTLPNKPGRRPLTWFSR
jgi:AbrB family looped-hinge helix DNA binding protein